MLELGLLFAVVTAACWGSQFVPLRMIKKPDASQFHIFMSLGIALVALAIALGTGAGIVMSPLAIFSGLVWGAGNLLYMRTIRKIGLSKGAPVIHGTAIASSFAIGVLILSETLAYLALAAAGVLLLVLGIKFVAVGKKKSSNIPGILSGASTGIVFAVIFTMLRVSELQAAEFLLPMAIGIFAGAMALSALRLRSVSMPHVCGGLLSGSIWAMGAYFGLSATVLLGLAVGFPLTQTTAVFAAMWGLFYFKEIRGRRDKLRILAGALVIIAGAFLLSFSKV